MIVTHGQKKIILFYPVVPKGPILLLLYKTLRLTVDCFLLEEAFQLVEVPMI